MKKVFRAGLFLLFLVPFLAVCQGSERVSDYNDFKKNPYTTKDYRKAIRPFLMDANHPIKQSLDRIFTKKRVTSDMQTFLAEGFSLLPTNGRSFVRVAKHSSLPGYLVKVCFDDEQNRKRQEPSWVWLVRRCELSQKIAAVIKSQKCYYFTVAKKWIYPLPLIPAALGNEQLRKHEILVVTDMDLASEQETKEAWQKMTKKHLKQLYTIITYAGGGGYRKDNLPFTKSGKFAFIDTEYPYKAPKYETITPSLSPEMQIYWKKLVQKGNLIP